MNLISLAISLLIVTLTLTYCLKGGGKISEKQAQVKCTAEGLNKSSEAYKKCVKEDAEKPMYKRALEIKKEAQDTRDLINKINRNTQKMLDENR